MANKTGKFLAFIAVATAAAAGGVALYKKYKEANQMDNADFDLDEDFEEDFSDIASEGGRDYVTIPLDNASPEESDTEQDMASNAAANTSEDVNTEEDSNVEDDK